MCGIAGIWAYRGSAAAVSRGELAKINERMAKRGPDGSGTWLSDDERVGLTHRRLSIIDLSERGAQPMHSDDGKLVITFNGEIYNYRALRSDLEARGYVFRSDSDTEVLLHLYAAHGQAMVERLRGMFAFAIWDRTKSGLFLARDPYGIKPFYYADDAGTLRFASQVKALLAGGGVSTEPEPAGWVGFHLFGNVPEPFTTYRAIRSLPAGSTLWIDKNGAREPRVYFSIAATYRAAEVRPLTSRPAELQEYFRVALLDSVRHHMVADVPVGIFLSAGIDSGALLGLMQDVDRYTVEAVTLTYEEFQQQHEDDAPLAALCAKRYGIRHTIRVVTEKEFHDDLSRIFDAMDQPTIDGINTWFVSKAARELGLKAAVSGLGGDELFGGYPSFHEVPRLARLWKLPSWLHVDDAFRYFSDASGLSALLNPKVAGLAKYAGSFAGAYFLKRGLFMPWELKRLMEPAAVDEGLRRLQPLRHIAEVMQPEPRSGFAKVAALESSIYMRNQLLRDTDWASMAHSLEVRVPLVDIDLLRATAPTVDALQGNAGKRILAASPRLALPPEIVDRPKTGFGTPLKTWLQRDERLQSWRHVPQLVQRKCPWARRWAYQLAAA